VSTRRKDELVSEQVSRQEVVNSLRRLGFLQVADEAARDLPDPVDQERIQELCDRLGLSLDEFINRMGGSP
jgi:hypothetical protein